MIKIIFSLSALSLFLVHIETSYASNILTCPEKVILMNNQYTLVNKINHKWEADTQGWSLTYTSDQQGEAPFTQAVNGKIAGGNQCQYSASSSNTTISWIAIYNKTPIIPYGKNWKKTQYNAICKGTCQFQIISSSPKQPS